ncbi:MAG: IS200/IS605 family transposase [Patescibacteria group bacterium]|nr:IS200/IS605 family transposase [Patescibacteria group bacterium]
MSEYIHKSHNVSVLLYHFVCPAKYRRVVFIEEVDETLKEVCLEISLRYDIIFIEIGTDADHVHFLIQSVPVESPTKIIRTIKSITAKEIFKRHPEVKQKLWGGEFWAKGFYVNTVGMHGNENTIQAYVRAQGNEKEYKKIHIQQLALF